MASPASTGARRPDLLAIRICSTSSPWVFIKPRPGSPFSSLWTYGGNGCSSPQEMIRLDRLIPASCPIFFCWIGPQFVDSWGSSNPLGQEKNHCFPDNLGTKRNGFGRHFEPLLKSSKSVFLLEVAILRWLSSGDFSWWPARALPVLSPFASPPPRRFQGGSPKFVSGLAHEKNWTRLDNTPNGEPPSRP